jgi:hypothetical protein
VGLLQTEMQLKPWESGMWVDVSGRSDASAADGWKEAGWQGYAVQILCRTTNHDFREEGMCPRCHVFPAQSAAKTGHHGLPSANHSPLAIFGACGPSNPFYNSHAAEFFEISNYFM